MKINIDNLALEIAADTLDGKLNKSEIKEVVRAIFQSVKENIAEGHEVMVPGFGKFRRRETKARIGRNPKTGEALPIAAKKAPAFTAAKEFKQAVGDA